MRVRVTRRILCILFAAALASTHLISEASAQLTDDTGWILGPEAAAEFVEDSEVTILDARPRDAWKREHVAGAVHFDWKAFTPERSAERGRLLSDVAKLTEQLRELGVSNDRRVIVVGAGDGGWGEAGRAVWMLRTLGHGKAAWVDGGHDALVSAGVQTDDSNPHPEPGDFDAARRSDWSIDREKLRETYREEDVVLLDTRKQREYDGETPYGESRGGHIPGAEHLHFRELLDENGRLLPTSKLRTKLRDRGVQPEKTIVVYCTGGVRSAWVVSVLVELGYPDVRNYAGSTWEWAAGPSEKFPLTSEN